MGEEQDNAGVDFRRPVWILDPVDGTTNLIHGYRHSAVSLALSDGGRVVLGLVYDPYADELFTAVQGKGARCNGAPIRTSGAQTLAESLVDVGTNPSDRPAPTAPSAGCGPSMTAVTTSGASVQPPSPCAMWPPGGWTASWRAA